MDVLIIHLIPLSIKRIIIYLSLILSLSYIINIRSSRQKFLKLISCSIGIPLLLPVEN